MTLTVDPIDRIRTDMDCIVRMSFLKCLVLLNRVSSGKLNRAGGSPLSFQKKYHYPHTL
jgi:hypothetical protein